MDIFDLFRSIETKRDSSGGSVSFLIVGLGNPGERYDRTRHNVGFYMIDALAKKMGVTVKNARYHALIGEGEIGGVRAVLMKPQTFMNNSGEAVGECARFYKIPPERVLVLCDDISFAPGRLRIRRRGSAGGHAGRKSSGLQPRRAGHRQRGPGAERGAAGPLRQNHSHPHDRAV